MDSVTGTRPASRITLCAHSTGPLVQLACKCFMHGDISQQANPQKGHPAQKEQKSSENCIAHHRALFFLCDPALNPSLWLRAN